MDIWPSLAEIETAFQKGRGQLVWTKVIGDLETPVSAMLKLADNRPYSFLLESIEGGRSRGRYSAIGLMPDLIWRSFGNRAEINRQALNPQASFEATEHNTLASLEKVLQETALEIDSRLPPMAAGLFGYLGYENVRLMERLAPAKPNSLGIPDGLFVRPTLMIVFDHVEDSIFLITPLRPEAGRNASGAYQAAQEILENALMQLGQALPVSFETNRPIKTSIEIKSSVKPEQFKEAVRQAKEYIAAGDIFQVVLSQRFSCSFPLPAFHLYRSLRRVNPSPFLFFFNCADFAITGSSPEILVRLRDNVVTIRPIAGTRPRGVNPERDRELASELLADPKELAEHLMLLDLGRNDVGRVAETGSVCVTEKMIIERYSHVMHIVSNVEGKLRPGLNVLDALKAGFPAGTVSGAPKIRAMEIIDELEPICRGLYGGAVGYFSADGAMDTCIALRTALIKDGNVYVQAGGGIVADSDPAAEDQESRHKARALFRAVEDALGL